MRQARVIGVYPIIADYLLYTHDDEDGKDVVHLFSEDGEGGATKWITRARGGNVYLNSNDDGAEARVFFSSLVRHRDEERGDIGVKLRSRVGVESPYSFLVR